MIVKSDGIILKTMKYGDTSRIITAYTKDFGKISFIAKGARGKKSKFGSALEPMSFSHLVYYYKSERDLQLLSQADLIKQFRGTIDDEKKLMVGFAMLEFLNAVTMSEDPHIELYELIDVSLSDLNDRITNGARELISFLANLSEGLGFALNFFHCIRCGTKLDEQYYVQKSIQFDPHDGGFFCNSCSKDGFYRTVHGESVFYLQTLGNETGNSDVNNMKRPFQESLELLTQHLTTHIEGMRTIRTLSLIHPFD